MFELLPVKVEFTDALVSDFTYTGNSLAQRFKPGDSVMRHIHSLAIAAALFIAVTTPALAGGIYLGGGAGAAYIEDSSGNPSGTTFDESSTAYRIFGGYRFDAIPIVKLSGELGYRDLGNPSAGGVEYGLSGFDYSALAGIALGPVEVYARLGGVQYQLEKTSTGVTTEFDGTAPLYGIGASFKLFGLGVRGEYEYMDVDELERTDMIWVSIFYEFF
jgi:Outer membrane protein beta-barrel domain